MRNKTAMFFLAALLCACAALLGGCTPQEDVAAVQSTPDLSVNISVPYATTTPQPQAENSNAPFELDSDGNVTVLDQNWIDQGFVSVSDDSSSTYYVQLRLGDQGEDVQALQARLQELGYYRAEITGVFDSLTEQAVQLFELTYGSMQTGIASESMQAQLFSDSAPSYNSQAYAQARDGNYEELQLGDVGSSVLALQYRLQELGYPLDNATGQYDRATASAVSLFFEEYGNQPSDVAIVSMQVELFTPDARTYGGATLAPTATPVTTDALYTLSEGNIGTSVERIQARLIELGYMQGSVTGTFDAATTEAVRLFQGVLGYAQDGVVTYSLYTQLLSADAPAYGSEAAQAIQQGEYTLLQEGDSGDAVLRLQNRLVELGYANGTPNGRYANATISAVQLFQRAAGLEETGVATAPLQALLFSDSAPAYASSGESETTAATGERYYPYNVSMTDLSEGDSGDLVVYLQTRLRELEYYSGQIDGVYGVSTAEAVRALQKNMGLEQTGAASTALQEHLYSDATPRSAVTLFDQTQSFTTLQLGDSDADGESMGPVETLQKQLWELGYLDREAIRGNEGEFNDVTQMAVVDAQLAMGYVHADGVATQEFQAFLFSNYCVRIKK